MGHQVPSWKNEPDTHRWKEWEREADEFGFEVPLGYKERNPTLQLMYGDEALGGGQV